MSIRIALFFFFGFVCSQSFGQTPPIFITNVEHGLFYDLENPISLRTDLESPILFTTNTNAIVKKIDNTTFTVQPKQKGQITVCALDSTSHDTLLSRIYKVRNVPQPELGLGNIYDSMQIQLLPNALISWNFQEYVPTECLGEVRSGKISFENYEFSFNGDRIPAEIIKELYKIKRVYQMTALPVQLNVVISCPSCAYRNITRTYFLI